MLLVSCQLGLLYCSAPASSPKAGLTRAANLISAQDVSHPGPCSQHVLIGPMAAVTFVPIRERWGLPPRLWPLEKLLLF